MKQPYTSLDLVRHLYGEGFPSENTELRFALDENPLLREEFQELQQALRHLPRDMFNAKPTTLQKIMRYSASTALCQSK
ncbi:MAG: hypothetical protein RLY31_2643 [Bacteroidota bacterium]